MKFAIGFAVMTMTCFPICAQSIDVVYPGYERDDYTTKILSLALSYSEQNYQIKAYGSDLPKHQAFKKLATNNGIDVMFGGSTLEREALYRPVRFPLMKGLYGWRVSLVHKDNKQLFDDTNTLSDLQHYSAGQFNTWSDTKVLRANDITVATSSDYSGLYTMLHKKRFDHFPRSIIEVTWNIQEFSHLDLVIEPNVLIHYPSAYYVYVRKDNEILAQEIYNGLIQAQQDGSFDTLFSQHFGAHVERVKSEKRQIIPLTNPYLSPLTPIHNSSMWLNFD